jgi:hypothetical protein
LSATPRFSGPFDTTSPPSYGSSCIVLCLVVTEFAFRLKPVVPVVPVAPSAPFVQLVSAPFNEFAIQIVWHG